MALCLLSELRGGTCVGSLHAWNLNTYHIWDEPSGESLSKKASVKLSLKN